MNKLIEQDYIEAAQLLNCEVAAIKAVTEVESRGSGFLETGEPIILFERHIFSRRTGGKYDKVIPELSNRKAGGYGKISEQHDKLRVAVKYDRNAALMSASWGLFQIMGFNYGLCGFASIQDFINSMYKSEKDHLLAFCNYIRQCKLEQFLIDKDWTSFAKRYNGPAFKQNQYDAKLEAAYIKHTTPVVEIEIKDKKEQNGKSKKSI
jgi:hypothetical protein